MLCASATLHLVQYRERQVINAEADDTQLYLGIFSKFKTISRSVVVLEKTCLLLGLQLCSVTSID